MKDLALPTYADAQAAARRLADVAVRTPLLESETINAMVGGRLLIKAEPLQRTGSFKFRGAYNKLARLSAEGHRSGIVAYSGGNHAQGAAASARLLGINAIIMMPKDAPDIKIRRTAAHGAEIIFYDRWLDDRDAMAAGIIGSSGRTLVKSFDDPDIIAGQATVGIEIVEQAHALGVTPDLALVPCGGGGLAAGVSMALRQAHPALEVYCVEPEGFDDTRRSLLSGQREANPLESRSVCDALLTQLGELTFAMNRHTLAGGLVVSDKEVCHAMSVAFEELKLVVEPGGAVALAAALSGKLNFAGRTAAIVLSGGNVDSDTFANFLQRVS